MSSDDRTIKMSSIDDAEEFMKIAQQAFGVSADEDDDTPRGVPPFPERARDAKKKLTGNLSQYASLGGQGYCPTSSTIRSLPPDCYNLAMTMEGQIIFLPQRLVTDSLLRLPDSRSDEVVSEVEKFWTLKDKFNKFGFAHKRGFLLFGPPGSGKTSTIAIITNDMIKKGGIVILAESPGVLAKALGQLRTIEPERPVVVIMEDIDTIIRHHGESQVLSVLDGEAQIENVVYIATTNYPENLDGRITNRPSRFDKIVKIGMPNAAAREMYLKSRLNTIEHDGVNLVEETDGLSIAHIKELIIGVFCQENPVKEVVARLQKMKVMPKSDGDLGPIGFGFGGRK